MPDVAKILRLVEEGALTPEEADRILAGVVGGAPNHGPTQPASSGTPDSAPARHLRVEVTEGGRTVVNLRVPINVASFAAGIVPGLPDAEAERVRDAIRSGARGSIVDITSENGDRVLIATE